ncbi:MAG: hypothetical protein AAFN78_10350 [Pseudomonadota bacterium]
MARLLGFVLGALLVIGVLSQMDGPALVAEPAAQPAAAEPEATLVATAAPVEQELAAAHEELAAVDEPEPVLAEPAPVEAAEQTPSMSPERSATAQSPALPPSLAEAPLQEPAFEVYSSESAPLPPVAERETAVETAGDSIGFFEEDVPTALPAPETVPSSATANLDGPQWEPVWQAFAARRSAEGFSQRLASLTGLDYRVEKLAPGRYQVEVGYVSEPERALALSRIEEATGLVLARSDDDSP